MTASAGDSERRRRQVLPLQKGRGPLRGRLLVLMVTLPEKLDYRIFFGPFIPTSRCSTFWTDIGVVVVGEFL